MPKILHITPHLGGGVGRVLLNYFQAAHGGPNQHGAACLDGANAAAKARAESIGLSLFEHLGRNHEALFELVKAADLVVTHWWNHPLLSDLLWRGNWPAARVLLWSHVSGALPPQVITPYLAAFPDIFAAASPVTLGLPVFSGRAEPRRGIAPPQINGDSTIASGNGLDSPITFRPRLLFSSAGVGHVARAEPRPHQGFRIGYLGTVDYAKMHPDFIDMSLAAQLPPDVVFTVAGGPEHEALKREVDRRGLAGRFEIIGPIDDVEGFLAELDVFGYPLNPEHYGTGEQVLIEAQAAGAPPVVLGGGAEEYVVEDGLTGLVAKSPEDYGACLARLYHQRDLRSRLAAQAGR
ncbi:glycosyltransferase family 4 protein, partial [Deltaproteobacteria bacterium OttesenSCG-928-K17]|nr:glycosyltransferase family 4 protein [Deltaproteobacteria bacterium OttesenSCG-928-K17]